MNKLESTLKKQRIVYCVSLAICVVLIVVGESNVFVDLQTDPDFQQCFTLEIVSHIATLASLPIAVKMKRSAKLWLVPLCCAVVLVCYYITQSSYSVLCLAIVAFALVYIFPKKKNSEGICESKTEEETEKNEDEKIQREN